MKTIEERWMDKIRVSPGPLPTPCWMWTAATTPQGYGVMGVGFGRNMQAHRIGWELSVGPIPPGALVCHKCDVPGCVCPSHMFLGDHKSNAADMVAKGRVYQRLRPDKLARGARNGARQHPERCPRGDGHGMAIMTECYVRSAREQGKTTAQVVQETGVGRHAAKLMLTRRTWKHVP